MCISYRRLLIKAKKWHETIEFRFEVIVLVSLIEKNTVSVSPGSSVDHVQSAVDRLPVPMNR